MKILFFIESLRSGGKERRLVELIKGLQNYPEIKCELILTREDIHYKEILDTRIKIHSTIRKKLKKDPQLFWKFYKIAKKYKPDIIHVWGNMAAIYAIPAKILLHITMINNQITDAPINVNKGFFSHLLTFPFSDKIVANTYAGLKSYNSPLKKSLVIYNGFEFSRIHNLKSKYIIRHKFNIETHFVVGMVASFSKLKDYATYIKAANIVLEKRQDVTFLCIGSGDNSEYIKRVQPLNKDKIRFLGLQQNVENIINICDIGVLATYTEGLSNSIMEFMALGKPVIATDGGGTKELIVDKQTGFLVEAKSSNELAEKVLLLLNDSEKRSKFGMNGKMRIEKEFNINKMIEDYINTYKTILNITKEN